jgi:SET domain-containing protein
MAEFERDELLLEYVGEIITAQQRKERDEVEKSYYLYELCDRRELFIDAKNYGNMSRFINHSCSPNCIATRVVVDGTPRIGIFTIRKIQFGEEITMSYGLPGNP